MKLSTLFKKRLSERSVIWYIGVPYTQEQFMECCKKEEKSDFIDSLEFLYGTTDEVILWEHYAAMANRIKETIAELESRNIKVCSLESIEQLQDAFSYQNIIITAHHHRCLPCLDFMGNTIAISDLVNCFPHEYNGIVDISSCFSTSFQMSLKVQSPNATFIAANTESSIDLRLFIYRHTIAYLAKHQEENYLQALRQTTRRIIQAAQGKEMKEKENVYLGGKSASKGRKPGCSASAFAPNRIRIGERMLVQVYLFEEQMHGELASMAAQSDEDSKERSYAPLNFKLKKGDTVTITLSLLGIPECAQSQSVTWQGRLAKVSFYVSIPNDYAETKIYAEIFMAVNDAVLGELDFVTKIGESEQEKKACSTIPHQYKKVFISYSHLDEEKVKFIDSAYHAAGVEHFFDRRNLNIGDVYSLEIEKYIATADLFILCWSANAEKSDYIQIEIEHALKRAFPQNLSEQALKFYPISIEPRASLPSTLASTYNFGTI